MGRYGSIIYTFAFLNATAFSKTLLELCRNNVLSNECTEMSLDCQNVLIAHLETFMMHMNIDLQCLSLSNTHLTNIEEGAFEGSTSLKYLNLQGNMLSHLDSDVFTNLKELEYLDLSYNSLRTLFDERLFASQQKLRVLKLSSNKISHVDVKVLKPLESITTLNLSDNPFHCDCQVLELLFTCRSRGLNTSVDCEEPKELEGISWEVLENIIDCKGNSDLLNSSFEEYLLVPKYIRISRLDYIISIVLLSSLIILIMLLVCVSIGMVFYIRKKKNKIEPRIEDGENNDIGTGRICCDETVSPSVHQGLSYIALHSSLQDLSNGPDSSDVFKESLLDTDVLVRDSNKCKYVENPRYSGEYDNVNI